MTIIQPHPDRPIITGLKQRSVVLVQDQAILVRQILAGVSYLLRQVYPLRMELILTGSELPGTVHQEQVITGFIVIQVTIRVALLH